MDNRNQRREAEEGRSRDLNPTWSGSAAKLESGNLGRGEQSGTQGVATEGAQGYGSYPDEMSEEKFKDQEKHYGIKGGKGYSGLDRGVANSRYDDVKFQRGARKFEKNPTSQRNENQSHKKPE